MKIGINLTREHVGGITSSNINLMNHLYKHDYEFVGIEITGRMRMKGPAIFRPFDPDLFDHNIVNIHHLPFPKALRACKTLTDVRRYYETPISHIRQILKDTRPDILLLNGTYYIPWLILTAARYEKIPVVLWYAGVLSKETAHFSKNHNNLCMKMERDMVRHADTIIFPSSICRETVEREVVKKSIPHACVIPNPIAPIFTDPTPTDLSVANHIAAVGRYSRIKNFDVFFEIHKKLKERKWNHTASFVTNPDADLSSMPRSIELLPSMTPEGLKKFYLSQGLIICPSLFETFGNVPMEAACLGIPVLVNETMGCAEILQKAGLENMVMSFNDIDAVTDRVQELCGQAILTKQINALRRTLDSTFVSEKIRSVIDATHNLHTTPQ